MSNNNKPKHFLVLKIVGFLGLAVAITGIIFLIIGFGDFETEFFMIGGFMMAFGLMATFPCLIIGFSPEISKLSTKTTKYIQQQNKEDLTDIANTSAEITEGAISKSAKAVKNGLKDTMFCKHCGAEIDSDSKFCKSCGKEL